MHLGLHYPRRSQVAPIGFKVGVFYTISAGVSQDAIMDCPGQILVNPTLQNKPFSWDRDKLGYGQVALGRLAMLHDASFLPRPIAVFLYPSFVVLPLSLGQADFYLGPAP